MFLNVCFFIIMDVWMGVRERSVIDMLPILEIQLHAHITKRNLKNRPIFFLKEVQ